MPLLNHIKRSKADTMCTSAVCVCWLQGLIRNCPTLDDPLPLFLATAYAANHPAMRLNNNDSFVQGTVQGAQWYTLLGGMQVRLGLHCTAGGTCTSSPRAGCLGP